MSKDTYKGESPGKKIARYHFWHHAVSLLGVDEFYESNSKVVFLASREGGDASVLKGACVDPGRLVGVDLVEDAVVACKAKHPDISVRHGDFVDVLKSTPNVSIAFMDLCCPLSAQTVSTIRRAFMSAPIGSVFGVAYMRGREKPSKEGIRLSRRQRRYAKNKLGLLDSENQLLAGNTRDIRISLKEASDLDGPLARARTLLSILQSTSRGRFGHLTKVIQYHSRVDGRQGVPMEIACFSVDHFGLYRKRDKIPSMECELQIVRHDKWVHLRREIVAGRWDPNAHLFLNIPKGRVAAWKAHASRGTYGARAALARTRAW